MLEKTGAGDAEGYGVAARLFAGQGDVQAGFIALPFQLAGKSQQFDMIDFSWGVRACASQRSDYGLPFGPAHHEGVERARRLQVLRSLAAWLSSSVISSRGGMLQQILASKKSIWSHGTKGDGRFTSGRRKGSRRNMECGLLGRRAKHRNQTRVLCHLWC
jgi:hypothetical protein